MQTCLLSCSCPPSSFVSTFKDDININDDQGKKYKCTEIRKEMGSHDTFPFLMEAFFFMEKKDFVFFINKMFRHNTGVDILLGPFHACIYDSSLPSIARKGVNLFWFLLYRG